MSPMRCVRRPANSSWKDCTRTGVSAAMKNVATLRANGRPSVMSAPIPTIFAEAPPGGNSTEVSHVKWINYSKYTGDDFGIDAEDLLKALSEFFLQSGYERQYMQFNELNQQTLNDLKEAIEQALREGKLFDQQHAEQMAQKLEQMSSEEFQQLIDRLTQKLIDEGYISADPQAGMGKEGEPREVKVEIT